MSAVQGCNSDGEIYSLYVEPAEETGFRCLDDGRTRQEFADECNINFLLATYERTGSLTHFNQAPPQYLDVSEVPDLRQALSMMSAAEIAFMTLPASVRSEFSNDPVAFVDYASDPANVGRMREWGLAAPAAAPEVNPDPPVSATPKE